MASGHHVLQQPFSVASPALHSVERFFACTPSFLEVVLTDRVLFLPCLVNADETGFPTLEDSALGLEARGESMVREGREEEHSHDFDNDCEHPYAHFRVEVPRT